MNITQEKHFKILSIDGGGIKGLYSAGILKHIEESLQKKTGDNNVRIVDYFDLVCGTSTGGLIALAISLRKPMAEVCDFYEKHGARIFPSPSSLYRTFIRQTLFRGKYSDKYLKKVLQEFFGDHKLADSHSLLCIPSYDFTGGTYAVFRFDHKEGNLNRHNKLKYVDVALSTSAAPTYFPLSQIPEENNTQYLDGGVWANNPTMVGLIESLRYFVGDKKAYQAAQIFSVSSLNNKSGRPPGMRRARAFVDWTGDLFELSLIGQSEFSDFFLSTMARQQLLPMEYLRIPGAEIAPGQVKHIAMDNASRESLNLMNQLSTAMYYKYKEDELLKKIFSSKKTYTTRNL
jgi:hypothetical protein